MAKNNISICSSCGEQDEKHHIPEEMINLESIVKIALATEGDTMLSLTKSRMKTVKGIAKELIKRKGKQ